MALRRQTEELPHYHIFQEPRVAAVLFIFLDFAVMHVLTDTKSTTLNSFVSFLETSRRGKYFYCNLRTDFSSKVSFKEVKVTLIFLR